MVDLWSLEVFVFEMCYGRMPFENIASEGNPFPKIDRVTSSIGAIGDDFSPSQATLIE